jgi:hypothetical protein
VYDTAPGDATSGLICPSANSCSTGWYVVGGTSASSPQWAALAAIADQIAGHGLGVINPTLYSLASGANYSTYFYDVTTGNNQTVASIPGYPATTGWDPVTGLGRPMRRPSCLLWQPDDQLEARRGVRMVCAVRSWAAHTSAQGHRNLSEHRCPALRQEDVEYPPVQSLLSIWLVRPGGFEPPTF